MLSKYAALQKKSYYIITTPLDVVNKKKSCQQIQLWICCFMRLMCSSWAAHLFIQDRCINSNKGNTTWPECVSACLVLVHFTSLNDVGVSSHWRWEIWGGSWGYKARINLKFCFFFPADKWFYILLLHHGLWVLSHTVYFKPWNGMECRGVCFHFCFGLI